jgi:hypothetical protein
MYVAVSPKKHRTDYIILSVLGVLTAGVLFAFVFWGWVRENRAGSPGIRTTRSTNVDAAIVCYTLLDRLGISVGRSEKVLLSETLDEIDVLFLLDTIIPIHSGEIKDIKTWLMGGGVLICTEVPMGLHTNLKRLVENKTLAGNSRRKPQKPKEAEPYQTTFIPTEGKDLPLARDISRVCFQTSETFDANLVDPNRSGNAIEPLLIDSSGIRIVTHKLGRGRLIVLSDSSFLANGQIGKNDNSVLAVNLVCYALSQATGKRLVFDEYHLGYGYHKTGFDVLSVMLFTTAAGWSVLSLTAAGVLFMIYKGRRFGIRRSLEKKRRRSKLEYIYAVGSTYRSAGANRLTLELILNWLKRKSTNLTGLAQNASNRAIAAELSRHSGVDSQKYKEILDRCDELLAQTSLSARQLLLTIKQLTQIETEVFNEHRKRK